MKINKQTDNNTTVKKKSPKKRPLSTPAVHWRDEYFCLRSWSMQKASDDYLEEKGLEFYTWAYNLVFNTKDPKPLSFSYWRAQKGIPYQTMQDWRIRNKKLDKFIKEGLEILGILREQGLLDRSLNERAVMYTLHAYMPQWKEHDAYNDARKAKLVDSTAQLIGTVFEEINLDEKDR